MVLSFNINDNSRPKKVRDMIEKITLTEAIKTNLVIEQLVTNLPTATSTEKGLMSAGSYKNWIRTLISISPGKTHQVQNIMGVAIINNKYLSNCEIIAVGNNIVQRIGGEQYDVTYQIKEKVLSITNNYSTDFTAIIVYQDLSY